MSDTIGKLTEYAHLVPAEHKNYMLSAKRFGFTLEGMKILRDHPQVPTELRLELAEFIECVEPFCAKCDHPFDSCDGYDYCHCAECVEKYGCPIEIRRNESFK